MKHPLLIALTLSGLIVSSALAENHHERDHWHGDIHYFHEHDLSLWRGGHWYHGGHLGHGGWWWVVNGIWYSYPRRVAVIPDPYVPAPILSVQIGGGAPAMPPPDPSRPTSALPPGGPGDTAGNPPPPAAAPATWYYCANPHGYYPYVTTCASGWKNVPATPPPGP